MNVTRLSLIATLSIAAAAAQPAAPTYETLNGVLWMQRSAEYKALTHQAYRVARLAIDDGLKDPNWTAATEQLADSRALPPAIILDLDETVLDNTPSNVPQLRDNVPFSEELWQKWVDQERAVAMPGAAEFLNYVRARGVAVFFISNRVCDASNPQDHTVVVLKNVNFPFDPSRLLCRADPGQSSDKSERRKKVVATHRVIAMFGDDLGDFVSVPSSSQGDWKTRTEARDRLIESYRDNWGVRWFVLPNPVYGSWERAIGGGVKTKLDALRQ